MIWFNRYELLGWLGQGASGEVWRARDLTTGDEVALKRVLCDDELRRRRWRQELIALRLAPIPGLVQLLDDRIDGSTVCLVMKLVEGTPFPTLRTPWVELRPAVLHLLMTLSHLHARGLVHRDLKPENVLVDAQGRTTVLDLDVSGGQLLPSAGRPLGATEGYAAPEQLHRPADARADVWALGVMLYAALTGRLPRPVDDPSGPAQLRPQLDGLAPEPVVDLLTRMLSVHPETRPGSAHEVLVGMFAVDPFDARPLLVHLPEPASEAELQRLFPDDRHLLHTGEDAARALLQRTGGWREHVAAELAAWLHTGRAVREGDRLIVGSDEVEALLSGERVRARLAVPVSPADAPALAAVRALAPEATPARVAALIGRDAAAALQRLEDQGLVWRLPDGCVGTALAQAYEDEAGDLSYIQASVLLPPESAWRLRLLALASDAELLADATSAWADHQLEDGRLPQVLPLLATALWEVRRVRNQLWEHAICLRIALAALQLETPGATVLGLRLVEGQTRSDRTMDALSQLLRAWRASLEGQHERACELATALSPFEDDRLDGWRMAILHRAARRAGPQEEDAWLERARGWAAGSPRNEERWQRWSGLRYHARQRFEEAAVAHRMALQLGPGAVTRLSARLNLARALLDGRQLAEARETAALALAEADRMRRLHIAALSVWILRTAALLAGQPLPADPAWMDEAARVRPDDGALLATVEAVSAWRLGDPTLAHTLALRGAMFARRASQEDARTLLLALAAHLGEPTTLHERLELVRVATERAAPGVAAQVIALLLSSGLPRRWRPVLRRLARRVPRAQWPEPREVWSITRCLEEDDGETHTPRADPTVRGR